MSCRLIFVKFENVSGGAAGYYDLVDSQNRVLFENLSSSQLETGMTFSVDNEEIQFRLANFRLDGDSNPCQTSTTTTTTTVSNYTWTQLCDTVNIVQDSQGRIIKRVGGGLGEWANVLVSNQTASGPFTIEFIKYFNETAPNMNIGITSKTTCSSPSYNTIDYGWFSVRPFNSNISPWYNNSFNAGPAYVDNKIYKIVFDGTNIEWYYDNVLVTTQTFTGTLPVKLAITQSTSTVEFLNIIGFA